MNASSLTPDEIRAAAETHNELDQQYRSAVIDSFIEKVGKEIDARVDARIAASYQQPRPPAERSGRDAALPLAIVSIVMGIPLTAITLGITNGNGNGLIGLLVIWLAIATINVAYAFHFRPGSGQRSQPGQPGQSGWR